MKRLLYTRWIYWAAMAAGAGLFGAVAWWVMREPAVVTTPAPAQLMRSAPVVPAEGIQQAAFDGVVEAVRQTVMAAQVAGAVVELRVKAGDTVRAGQVLLRIDARAAEQNAAASAAQVRAARAAQEVATRDFERQKQLFANQYISQAALDRAEAQFKATQAEAAAQFASAGAAQTQSGFYVVKAPYDGVVSDVAVVLGDMAMPGRPLLSVYDPAVLRVKAPIPQSVAATLPRDAAIRAEVPGTPARWYQPLKTQVLPTVDAATHTAELRLDLPPGAGPVPGMFARAWLPAATDESPRLFVPLQAVVRRAEMTGVYVLGPGGAPLLRQVRLGRTEGERVEVLSGLSSGEQVALDPQAAARTH
jgi:multidrug efflux system membrane fusion protein